MPELPEVENVVRKLKEKIIGQQIKSVLINWNPIIEYPKKEEFIKQIRNQEVLNITRRGKWIIMELTEYFLFIHLRMEGKFSIKQKEEEYSKHEHVIFTLDSGKELRYADTRKFGKMSLVLKEQLEDNKPLKNMGFEPFDEGLTVDYLKEKFRKKMIPIKSSLLDQKIIAGIGNIYVDEILFLARIYPQKRTSLLTKKEIALIIQHTKNILAKAIEVGGTKIRTYTSLDGETGHYQEYLNVHTKVGKPCPICGNPIAKMKVNGRGTYYCTTCQKKPNKKKKIK